MAYARKTHHSFDATVFFLQMFQKESDKGLIEVLLTLQNAF